MPLHQRQRPQAACRRFHSSSLHAFWLPAQVFLTPNYLGIVTDFADQGELATQITKQAAQSGCADMAFTEPEARHLFQQLIIAVDFCHRKGISNRDLKVRSFNSLGWLPGMHRALLGITAWSRRLSCCRASCGKAWTARPAGRARHTARLRHGGAAGRECAASLEPGQQQPHHQAL